MTLIAFQINACADDDPTLYITSTQADAGQTITLEVGAINSTELAGLVLDVKYDDSVFTLSSYGEGDLNGTLTFSPEDRVPFRIMWLDALHRLRDQNGTFAVLNFTVNDDAKSGDYDLTLSYEPGNCIDADGNDLDYEMINAVVSVNGTAQDDVDSFNTTDEDTSSEKESDTKTTQTIESGNDKSSHQQ